MRFAKISEIWNMAYRREVYEGLKGQVSVKEASREVRSSWPKSLLASLNHDNAHLNDEDMELLQNFSRHRSQTMGDILTVNSADGSQTMFSLEKLIGLGFIKRDWEKEIELRELAVYSITPEGRYLAQKVSG